MAKPKKPEPITGTSSPATVAAPTGGMWRNSNVPVNGSAPSNGGAK